jgi:hypothetical protein
MHGVVGRPAATFRLCCWGNEGAPDPGEDRCPEQAKHRPAMLRCANLSGEVISDEAVEMVRVHGAPPSQSSVA